MLYSPKAPPYTVMLSAPDAALLAWTKRLVRAVSQESVCVALPVLMPAVTTWNAVIRLLGADWQRAVESDTQLVPSHVVTTLEANAEYTPALIPPPWMVTLADPVSTPFRLVAPLAVIQSPVNASDTVLARSPAVATMRKVDSEYIA